MATVFPNNNLPTAAQPWAREVTKQLSNLISSTASAQINNAARDDQLNSLIQSVIDGAKIREGSITANQISASYIYAGEIEADQITAGTLSGITIQTSSASDRIEISASTTFPSIVFSNTGYGTVGSIYSQYLSSSSYAGISIDAPNVDIPSGNFIVQGSITASGGINGTMAPTTSSTTGTANIYQSGSGSNLIRVSSARRYKLDIQDVDYGTKVLGLRPRTWIDKYYYEQNGDSAEGLKRIPGFVAEEVLEAGLEEFVIFNEEGQVESLHYDRIVGALIPVLKQQQKTIEELTARVETLEKGA